MKILSIMLVFLIFITISCAENKKQKSEIQKESRTTEKSPTELTQYTEERELMVKNQIIRRGVEDKLVLEAMKKVPRHKFVLDKYESQAYEDTALPIDENQTISQPYIVALMTELINLKGGEKVLEIGTGSGYQAAVLAEIAEEVYTIEIIDALAKKAEKLLMEMGYENIKVKSGDGYKGWPEYAPFDAVIVTAAPDHVPQPLVDQLKEGGRLVIPVGERFQELKLLVKTKEGIKEENVLPVRFVPMTGEAQEKGK
ncbi:protein-L-isoaspartate(D-aspartate) O-methyltransferase [Candidatus Poribacteria bacterium]|nr:protein-L-isoaspartate(D-aspartate) O-methyltransferase [Candidatus Poribacteria bacterium]